MVVPQDFARRRANDRPTPYLRRAVLLAVIVGWFVYYFTVGGAA